MSANWVSRDGVPNLRGVATLLSLGHFLRGTSLFCRRLMTGQNHWAFDFALIIGDSYLSGLDTFMSPPSFSTEEHYHTIFPGVIWTALNIDYPGHSFSHIGVFYEGLNGRLPNQDVPNTLSHVGRWAGGVDMRLHDIDNYLNADEYKLVPKWGREYWVAARHLWEHAKYTALGRASGAHGVLAKCAYFLFL